jgi:hypothetical protein
VKEAVMSKSLLYLRVAVSLVMMWANPQHSAAGSFTHGCAARDMQILMLLEEREDANTLSAKKLDDAMLTMMQARMVCHDGRVMDAIALYDSIARSIEPGTPVAEQPREAFSRAIR